MARRKDDKLWLDAQYGATVTVPASGQTDRALIEELDWDTFGSDECVHLRTVGQMFMFPVGVNDVPWAAAIRVSMLNENTALPLNPGQIDTADGIEGQSLIAIRHGYANPLPNQGLGAWTVDIRWTMWDTGVQRRLRRPMTMVVTLANRAAAGGPNMTWNIWLRTLVRIL